MDELWRRPESSASQIWDLRFNQIEYLRREADEPRNSCTALESGFGFTIDGKWREHRKQRRRRRERYVEFEILVADPKSLIKVGSGYCKYVPQNHDSLLYVYDYETRFSVLGR